MPGDEKLNATAWVCRGNARPPTRSCHRGDKGHQCNTDSLKAEAVDRDTARRGRGAREQGHHHLGRRLSWQPTHAVPTLLVS